MEDERTTELSAELWERIEKIMKYHRKE